MCDELHHWNTVLTVNNGSRLMDVKLPTIFVLLHSNFGYVQDEGLILKGIDTTILAHTS